MIDFIKRHQIESRLGNLNPDPIVPVDFRTSVAIPRHIAINTEEHDVYKNLLSHQQVLPVK
jgi:hypothetical protein